MTYQSKPQPVQVIEPAPDFEIVREFLSDHGDALANAAHLLGGTAASGRVLILIEALKESRRLTRGHRRQLVELHRLLSLEHVADPDRIEAGLFALIDPESPQVEEICRLTDRLAELLQCIALPDFALPAFYDDAA